MNQIKPTEATYKDYRNSVEISAEAVLDILEDHGDDYEDLHEVVWETVDGDRWVTNYGFMLATVLLSDQNPDQPDYCESWTTYVDLSADPSWSDVVSAMAYVCLYSDVMEKVKREQDDD